MNNEQTAPGVNEELSRYDVVKRPAPYDHMNLGSWTVADCANIAARMDMSPLLLLELMNVLSRPAGEEFDTLEPVEHADLSDGVPADELAARSVVVGRIMLDKLITAAEEEFKSKPGAQM